MSKKFTAEYRCDNKTYCIEYKADSFEDAERRLDSLKNSCEFISKDTLSYKDGRVSTRYFQTQEEAERHLMFIKGNAQVVGEIIVSLRVA